MFLIFSKCHRQLIEYFAILSSIHVSAESTRGLPEIFFVTY